MSFPKAAPGAGGGPVEANRTELACLAPGGAESGGFGDNPGSGSRMLAGGPVPDSAGLSKKEVCCKMRFLQQIPF